MKSIYGFVITPLGDRYNNKVKLGDKELVINSEMFNHQFVNRLAKVVSCPKIDCNIGVEPGDIVIVHHNVFRRWEDQHGTERNSKNYFDEQTYIIYADQIFAYKRSDKWRPTKGYCFVQPVKDKRNYALKKEKPLVGIVKYSDGTVAVGDLVGFTPNSEYEFIIEGKRLYRVMSKFITIKYEYQGDEEEYNPSWA